MLSILKYFGKPQKLLPIAYWINLKQAYRYSSGDHQLQDQQDIQQQAIIAYHAIENIRQLGQKPYVPFNRQSIINRVLSKAHLWNNKIGQESTWNLKQKNIDRVWSGFDDRIGAKVNIDIWCQRRFKEVVINDRRIVLMPSRTTGKIFKQLLNSCQPIIPDKDRKKDEKLIQGDQKAEIFPLQKNSFVIAGQKGTGKSFAYLIYDYLSQFIISYRMTQSYLIQQRVKKFYFFVPQRELKCIKKIIYYPLRQKQRFVQIYDHFAIQTSQLLFKNSAQSDLTMFQNLLRQIKLDFRSKNGIQVMFIIDEYNFYYSCFREMSKNQVQKETTTNKPTTDKATKNKKRFQLIVQTHSEIIESIAANFKFLIFNSSQTIEGEIITTWNRGKGAKFFNLYQHGATKIFDFNIKYTKDLDTIYGQIALYKILWRELCSQFFKVNYGGSLENNIQLKKAFLEIFGLTQECMFLGMNEVPNSLQFFLNQWEIDVRHLNIREAITDPNTTQKLFSLIKASKPNSHVQLANQLLVIKKTIETRRFNQVKSRFAAFNDKSLNDKTDLARFKIICFINQVAHLAKQRISQMENEGKKAKLQTKQYEQNQTESNNLYKSNIYQKKNRVLVDFTVLLPDQINEKQPQTDIQENNTIIKQIGSFIEQVGIGYRQKDNFKKCIFIISPKQLWQMTLLIDMDFTKYSASQLDLLIKKIRQNRLLGDHMDSLYYQFFSKNLKFEFLINQFQIKGKQKIKPPFKYNVSHCIGFRTRAFAPDLKKINNNDDNKKLKPQDLFDQLILNQYQQPKGNDINLPEQFKELLQAAQEHIGNYVLGYPVYADNNFAFNNPRYDFVLIKAQKATAQTSKKYYIHFFDLGVGKVYAKSREPKKIELLLLIQQFKKIKPFEDIPDENIEFKHIILAPKSQVAYFQKQMTDKKNQKQMNIVMKHYWSENPLSLKRIGKDKNNKEILDDYGFKMTYEIRFADYDVKQAHIKIPTNQNIENLLFLTMRRVLAELQIKESDVGGNQNKTPKKKP